jgi:hypothetical protein
MSVRLVILSFVCFTAHFLFPHSTAAQHPCGQGEVLENWWHQHPDHQTQYEQLVHKIAQFAKRHPKSTDQRGGVVYTIPVVFHVLHLGGSENISEAQIRDQIRILNRDFQKRNADTTNVVKAFQNNIANVGFEFQLASIDPNGKCTNGIVRHYTRKTFWDANKLEDFIYSWPRERYLNVYVVRSINIAPAYTFLPGVPIPPEADVIVCQSDLIGSIGTANGANTRVLTHEVGHWFGLPHIWGLTNAPGVQCGDDFVDDTPLTKGFVTCSISNSIVCTPGVEENVQNYMDYTPCKLMFTNGQSDYMHATIEMGINGRDYLVSEDNLIATGVISGNACKVLADFYSLQNQVCKDGSLTFVSLSQKGAAGGTLKWTMPGAIPETAIDSVVAITFPTAGTFTVKLVVSGPNGTDSISRNVLVIDGSNGQLLPRQIAFDNGLPSDLKVINADADAVKWETRNDIGANNTLGCIHLQNFGATNTAGYRDYFETDFFNLSAATKPVLSFYYAYARKFSNQSDSFRVEYSLDCGITWNNAPGVTPLPSMAISTGGISNTAFTPTAPSQWRKMTLGSTFQNLMRGKPSVKFRFYFKSDPNVNGSNNFYLDEINLTDELPTGLASWAEDALQVFPNPANGVLHLQFPSEDAALGAQIELRNLLGNVMHQQSTDAASGGQTRVVWENSSALVPGIYFLVVKKEGYQDAVKKIVIGTTAEG